jgi:hypothetical protein
MRSFAWRNPAEAAMSGHDVIVLALLISFPVIGLDLFLRTTPAQLAARPAPVIEYWVTDSLMALPLFAAGVWAGDRIAGLAGLGTAGRRDVLKRALVITLAAALALTPVWFVLDKMDNPARAQPAVAPAPRGGVDVYWAGTWVILALVCACLIPAAFWAGRGIGGGIGRLVPRRAAAVTRTAAPALLVAVVPVLAWLLHQAAEQAYASQVYYASAAGTPVTAAPFAFAYQIAHALQDGLAGQAAGLPVAAIVLLRGIRGPHGRNQPTETRRRIQ